MTWRRWVWGDAKTDITEYHLSDVPHLPGLPNRDCAICHVNLDLVVNSDELPRLVRRGSKAVHVRAPGEKGRLRRTRCGRYYVIEREQV